MADQIPRPDGKFDDFQDNFMTKANTYRSGWSLPPIAATEWAAILVKQATWVSKYAKVRSGEFTHADVTAKNVARKDYERNDPGLRHFIARYISKNPYATLEQRRDMGLTIPDTNPTPAPSPELEVPLVSVKKIMHLTHVVSVMNPDHRSKAKGKGIKDIQVFRYIGTAAPAGSSAYQYVGDEKRGLFTSKFTDVDVGKTAWYIARYKSTRGEFGPFSLAASAPIA